MLHPSVTSYQCFRGRKKHHTTARKSLFFSLFFHPQKPCSKAPVLDWSNIQRARFTAFQQTITSLDTLGTHIPFLSKLFISVTCYDHLIHNSHSCEKPCQLQGIPHFLSLSAVQHFLLYTKIYVCLLHSSGSHHVKQAAKLVV